MLERVKLVVWGLFERKCPRLCFIRRWFVCLSVCLSVSNIMQNYRPYLHENFTSDVSLDKEELVKLWKSSASASESYIFWHIVRHCSRAFFYNLAHIRGEADKIFVNILQQMYIWTRKSTFSECSPVFILFFFYYFKAKQPSKHTEIK